MTDSSFSATLEDIQHEIIHMQTLIASTKKNLGIIEGVITRHGNSNIDLHFRKADLEDDLASQQNRLRTLEAREQELSAAPALHISGEQSTPPQLQTSIEILYTHLPTGVLSLYNPQTMPLLRYKVINNTNETIDLILQSEIEDFSFSTVDQVQVPPRSEETFYQLPLLKTYKLETLNKPTKAIVHVHIKEVTNEPRHQERQKDFEVEFMSRNVIRWAVPDATKNSGYLSLLEHIAAWVTPNTEAVAQTLRDAANYTHSGFDGYPKAPDSGIVRNQVRAIYLALKEKVQLAFVSSPFALGSDKGKERQIVRLPDETLKTRSGNCIDRAVLYASLIEQAGLEPVIVFLTDHAFIGWKTHTNVDNYEFLETTMPLQASFEDTLNRGMDRYHQLIDKGWFQQEDFNPDGFARLLDIKALHSKGIYRM